MPINSSQKDDTLAKTNRRHFFSLLEVLVALSLMVALMASLLFVYRTSALAQSALNDTLWHARRHVALDQRLQELFFAVPSSTEAGFWFYCESGSALVFAYHNGIDPDPKLSSLVLGKLYRDQHDRLLLATWPHPDLHGLHHNPRIEVLAGNVSALSFSFYEPSSLRDPEQSSQTDLAITAGHSRVPIPPKLETDRWLAAYSDSPALITLHFTFQNEPSLSLRFTLRGVKKSPHTWYYSKDQTT